MAGLVSTRFGLLVPSARTWYLVLGASSRHTKYEIPTTSAAWYCPLHNSNTSAEDRRCPSGSKGISLQRRLDLPRGLSVFGEDPFLMRRRHAKT